MQNLAPKSALAAVVVALRSAADAIEALPPPVVEAGDELRPIAAFASEWGLEATGLAKAIKRAGVRTVKIGRARAVRRSDVVALVDELAEQQHAAAPPRTSSTTPDAAYRALVEKTKARGRR